MEDPRNKFEFGGKLTAMHKLYQDAEQLEHLAKVGLIPRQEFEPHIAVLRGVASELAARPQNSSYYGLHALAPRQSRLLGGLHNRNVHHQAALAMLPQSAVKYRSRSELARLEEKYYAGATQGEVLVLDDFLQPEALERLHNFVLNSTLWTAIKTDGYLGSYLPDGFSSPLLFQVATELREMFPTIFRQHHLHLAWAYKYNSSLSGIGAHADPAAVNVNLWLTPDASNLDPDRGGLVVYRVVPPSDWNEYQYNAYDNDSHIENLLSKHKWRNITIPYKANRIVIFNSNLFHRTDHFKFKAGFSDGRINLTFLFGSMSKSHQKP